jgi:hypothetical protein
VKAVIRKNSSKRERETTSQRAAREYARRTTLCHAKEVAELITARRRNKEDMAPEDMMEVLLYWGDIWGPDIERAYVSFGRVVCELEKNPPRFLRLVADLLEGKHPYSPGADWYDDKITAAYEAFHEAFIHPQYRVVTRRGVSMPINDGPSFSEFLHIFRKKNPQLQRVSERSLRRSLQRLGYPTREMKRGRPKNRDRKPRSSR